MGKSHSIPDKEKNILRNALRALLLQRENGGDSCRCNEHRGNDY